MHYQLLKIRTIKPDIYEIDMVEERWIFKPKTFKGVRIYIDVLGEATWAGTKNVVWNLRHILQAYDCTDLDFTTRTEPLPIVWCINPYN